MKRIFLYLFFSLSSWAKIIATFSFGRRKRKAIQLPYRQLFMLFFTTPKKYLLFLYASLSIICVATAQDDSDVSAEQIEDIEQIWLEAKYANSDVKRIYLLERALKIARRNNETESVKKTLIELNKTWNPQREANKSLRFALEELNYAKKENNPIKLFSLQRLIGDIYRNEKNTTKAIEFYKKAEIQFFTLSNEVQKAQFAETLGDDYISSEQIDIGLPYLFQALDFYQNTTNSYSAQSRVLQKIIEASLYRKDFKSVYGVAQRLKNLAKKQGNKNDEAIATNNIGTAYHLQNDFTNAILYFEEALLLHQNKSTLDLSTIYTNLGVAYQNTNDFNKAITQFQLAMNIAKTQNKKATLARIEHLIANVYLNKKDLFNAQQFNNAAIASAKQSKNYTLLANTYSTAASIFQLLYEYDNAFDAYRNYLTINDSLSLFQRGKQQDLERQIYLMEKAEKELQLSLINQDIQELTIQQLQFEKERIGLENEKKDRELVLLISKQAVTAVEIRNKELEAEQSQKELELTERRLQEIEKDKALSSLRQQEALQKATLAQQNAEEKKNLSAISLLTKDKDLLLKDKDLLVQQTKIDELELENQRSFRQTAYGVGALLAVILGLIGLGYILARRNNSVLAQKNKEIEIERRKSDELLLNILPEKTARELKENGVAVARHYEMVTILFADFTNFTKVAATLSPQQLIEELNDCFIAFDEIIVKYRLEKIKTIGDAYMCAGGVPTPNTTNATDTVAAALELMAFMRSRNERKKAKGERFWTMRIGINTGEAIAGVVGKQKFAYDIWGDAVNVASRLESSSEPGEINISATTYALVKNDFPCDFRGVFPIKNKGEIEMYFVRQ